MRVLVVEDETMVSILIEDMLSDLDHVPVGPASSIAGALALIDNDTFDVALLDINLGGQEKVFPIADILDERGIPYALVSGYAPQGVDDKYYHATKLQKPFSFFTFKETVNILSQRLCKS